MAIGDTSVQIVTAPINATTIKTAVDAALGATTLSAAVTCASFNDGRGMAIIARVTGDK